MKTLELFKKCSPDGRLAIYLEKRDFYDHFTHVDYIDGLLSFDPSALDGYQVFLSLNCTCRYGREDLDVLGLTLQLDLLGCSCSVWPENSPRNSDHNTSRKNNCWNIGRRKKTSGREPEVMHNFGGPCPPHGVTHQDGAMQPPNIATRPVFSESMIDSNSAFVPSTVQQRLMNRLGVEGHPFRITLPPFSPSSVIIQQCDDDNEKPCGVIYELSAHIGRQLNDMVPASLVCMLIRKLTNGPSISNRPCLPISFTEIKYPLISTHLGYVTLSLNIDKQLFYHGETLPVSVSITNNSRLPIRKVIVKVLQITQLLSITKGHHQTVIDKEVTRLETPILSGGGEWTQKYTLRPSFRESAKRKGVALEGMLKKTASMNLASSSVFRVPRTSQSSYYQMMQSIFNDLVVTESQKALKEQQGMVVSYAASVECFAGLCRLELKLPFFLMHPSLEDESLGGTASVGMQSHHPNRYSKSMSYTNGESSNEFVGQGPAFSAERRQTSASQSGGSSCRKILCAEMELTPVNDSTDEQLTRHGQPLSNCVEDQNDTVGDHSFQ